MVVSLFLSLSLTQGRKPIFRAAVGFHTGRNFIIIHSAKGHTYPRPSFQSPVWKRGMIWPKLSFSLQSLLCSRGLAWLDSLRGPIRCRACQASLSPPLPNSIFKSPTSHSRSGGLLQDKPEVWPKVTPPEVVFYREVHGITKVWNGCHLSRM